MFVFLLQYNENVAAIAGVCKVELLENNAKTSSLNLDKDVFVRIEEIMDNEPEYQDHPKRWSYNRTIRILKGSNYIIPSIAHEKRQSFKEIKKIV